MGETLAETRVEVSAQRAQVESTAQQLQARVRRAFDIRAKVRENPIMVGGLAAGAVFLAVGGPIRLLRAARRRVAPTRVEQAYDTLPKALQRWVDAATDAVGPKAEDARRTLAEELQRWRAEPTDKKRARELAKEMAEGRPGPSRAAWKAFEAAATLISAALARRAVERFLSGDKPMDAAAELAPAHPANGQPGAVARRKDGSEGYSGWSSRGDAGR
jgi:hypothetical protein